MSGSVTWLLKATAHRPGAFKSRLYAQRKVTVVTCPTEEDTEDTENVIVERQWDGQMQYLITFSGRSFYIGGTIPISFTLLPLNKVKVHRIVAFIEGARHLKRQVMYWASAKFVLCRENGVFD
jgi:arrestin-related trafficking adapter 3/6